MNRYVIIGGSHTTYSSHRKLSTAQAKADRMTTQHRELFRVWDGKAQTFVYHGELRGVKLRS